MQMYNPEVLGVSLRHIQNRQERRVCEVMTAELADDEDFCGCTLCIEDVYACAMSRLRAHYLHRVSIVLKRPPPNDLEIHEEVCAAIEVVRLRPNHASVT